MLVKFSLKVSTKEAKILVIFYNKKSNYYNLCSYAFYVKLNKL